MMKDNYKDTDDLFAEKIRQKLEGHTLPVDDGAWEGIQRKLYPKRMAFSAKVFVPLGAVAALALLFTLGGYFFKYDAVSRTETIISEVVVPVAKPDPEKIVSEHSEPVVSQSKNKISAKADPAPRFRNAVPEKVPEKVSENTPEIIVVEASAVSENQVSVETEQQLAEVSCPESETDSRQPVELKEKEIMALMNESADWTRQVTPKKDKGGMMVAAGAGSGVAGTSAFASGRMKSPGKMHLVGSGGAETESVVLSPGDFKRKVYLPPVSVGLSLRFPVNKTFSVESGVAYSYLQTQLSESTWGDYYAELDLHYLGIPLNIVANLFRAGKWESYVSVGCTAEKGLWSVYRQYNDFGDARYSTKVNSSVDGMQWSLNAAMGVGYMIAPNMSVYIDPKLALYLDNNQPFSIRSVMPLQIVLNAGLRMSF